MSKGPCGACGTPKALDHFMQYSCPKCDSEIFFGLPTVARTEITTPKPKINMELVVDCPVYEESGVDVLLDETKKA